MPFKSIEDKRAADRRYRRRRRALERGKGKPSRQPWEAVRPVNEEEPRNSGSIGWWIIAGLSALILPGLLPPRS